MLRCSTAAIEQACNDSSSSAEAGSHSELVAADPYEEIVEGGRPGYSWGMAASLDGRWIAECMGNKTVELWDARTLTRANVLKGHSDVVWCAAFSADSKWIASGSENEHGSEIKVWDADSGRELRHLEAPDAFVTGLAFCRAGLGFCPARSMERSVCGTTSAAGRWGCCTRSACR